MENIEQRSRDRCRATGVNEADIKNESAFVEDLGADSLDTVELVMALETSSSARSRTRKRRRSVPSSRPSSTSPPTEEGLRPAAPPPRSACPV